MPFLEDNIRKDILERPCEKCDEPVEIDADHDGVMTFFRGEFIMLHEECAKDFIDYATKGPRGSRTKR